MDNMKAGIFVADKHRQDHRTFFFEWQYRYLRLGFPPSAGFEASVVETDEGVEKGTQKRKARISGKNFATVPVFDVGDVNCLVKAASLGN